jgi:hypothetical protein
MSWLERYPHAQASITHGFPWRTFLSDDRRGLDALPDALFAPFATGRCALEVSFPVRLGDVFEYPYTEVLPALHRLVSRCGAEQLHYGTDMPFQNRFCTYQQSRRYLERQVGAGGLSSLELEYIMGKTAQQLLGIEERDTAATSRASL